jgi:gem associated protein 5
LSAAVACGDKTIRLWEPCADGSGGTSARTTLLWKGVGGKVLALAFHPEREGVLAFGTEEGRVGVYDVFAQSHAAHAARHGAPVMALTWRPLAGAATRLCSLAADGALWEWRMALALSTTHREGDAAAPTSGAAGDAARALGDELSSIAAQGTPGQAAGEPGHITDAAWSPDGAFLAVGRERGALEVWRPAPGVGGSWACTTRLWAHAKGVTRVRWHHCARPDGARRLLSSAADGTLCAFEVAARDGTAVALAAVQAHRRGVQDAAWSPHADALVATASVDGTVRVWDVGSAAPVPQQALAPAPLGVMRGHDGRVLTVCWSASRADTLFSGSEDQTVRAWQWENVRHAERARPAAADAAAYEAAAAPKAATAPEAAAAPKAVATPEALRALPPDAQELSRAAADASAVMQHAASLPALLAGVAATAPPALRRRRPAAAKSLLAAPAHDTTAEGQQALRDVCISLVRCSVCGG